MTAQLIAIFAKLTFLNIYNVFYYQINLLFTAIKSKIIQTIWKKKLGGGGGRIKDLHAIMISEVKLL